MAQGNKKKILKYLNPIKLENQFKFISKHFDNSISLKFRNINHLNVTIMVSNDVNRYTYFEVIGQNNILLILNSLPIIFLKPNFGNIHELIIRKNYFEANFLKLFYQNLYMHFQSGNKFYINFDLFLFYIIIFISLRSCHDKCLININSFVIKYYENYSVSTLLILYDYTTYKFEWKNINGNSLHEKYSLKRRVIGTVK